MSRLRQFYLVAAVLGLLMPYGHYIAWQIGTGGSVGELLAARFASGAVAGLAWDMMIAAVVLSVFVIHKSVVKHDYLPLICLPVILLIGLGCALPLYLFLRSRPVG